MATGIILLTSARYGARPRRLRSRSYVAIAAWPPSNGSTGTMLNRPTKTFTPAMTRRMLANPPEAPNDLLARPSPTTVVGCVVGSSLAPVTCWMMFTGLSTFTTPPTLSHIALPRSVTPWRAATAIAIDCHTWGTP